MKRRIKNLWKNNAGEAVVEAAIYFPIAIIAILVFVCISLGKIQVANLEYQVDKTVDHAARATMYEGYADLSGVRSVTYKDEIAAPGAGWIDQYYQKKQTNEGMFGNGNADVSSFESYFQALSEQYGLYNSFVFPWINVYSNQSTLSHVKASANYYVELPWFVAKFTNYNIMGLNIGTNSISNATNPGDMIRAVDAVTNDLGLQTYRGINFNKLYSKYAELKNKRY